MPLLASQGNRRQTRKVIDRQDLKELWLLLDWQDKKSALIEHANLSRDALHVYAALLIFLGGCWLFKWKPCEWKPWLLVLAVQTVNEVFDMRLSYEDDGVVWIWANIKDMINTMALPTIFMIVARYSGIFNAEPAAINEDLGDKPEV